jgi:hypothetical protein
MSAMDRQPPAPAATRRRWYQFSLRTLLMTVVIPSVALGLFAARWHRARRQLVAVSVIRGCGGDVLYDFEVERDRDGDLVHHTSFRSSVPSWLLHPLGEDFFHGVAIAEVRFERAIRAEDPEELAKATGDLRDLEVLTFFGFDHALNFEYLRGLTKVRELTITIPPLETRDFNVIAQMKKLEVLHCSHQRIDGAAASHLGGLPKLRKFTAINGSMVDDEALEKLSRCRSLKELTICHTDITDVGVRHLATLPNLEWLDLDGTQVTDMGLNAVSKIQSLRFLNLEGTKIRGKGIRWPSGLTDAWLSETSLTDEGLQGLSKCQGLTRLHLGDTRITNAGLRHLDLLQKLEWLELDGTSVSDEGLAALGRLRALKHVSLNRTNVTDGGLAYLSDLPRLESVSLFDTKVTGETFEWPGTLNCIYLSGSLLTDAGLMRLAKYPKLNDILVEGTPITSDGFAKFKKARPDVNWTGY